MGLGVILGQDMAQKPRQPTKCHLSRAGLDMHNRKRSAHPTLRPAAAG
jgi:hypothetical protein